MKKSIFLVYVVVALDLLGVTIMLPVMPRLAQQWDKQTTALGFMYAAYSAPQVISSVLMGRGSDRFGRRPLLLLSLCGSLAGCIFQALAPSFEIFLLARICTGSLSGSITVAMAFITDCTLPGESRSKYMSYFGVPVACSLFVGPLLGGVLSAISLRAPMIALAILSGCGLVCSFKWLPETFPKARRDEIARQKKLESTKQNSVSSDTSDQPSPKNSTLSFTSITVPPSQEGCAGENDNPNAEKLAIPADPVIRPKQPPPPPTPQPPPPETSVERPTAHRRNKHSKTSTPSSKAGGAIKSPRSRRGRNGLHKTTTTAPQNPLNQKLLSRTNSISVFSLDMSPTTQPTKTAKTPRKPKPASPKCTTTNNTNTSTTKQSLSSHSVITEAGEGSRKSSLKSALKSPSPTAKGSLRRSSNRKSVTTTPPPRTSRSSSKSLARTRHNPERGALAIYKLIENKMAPLSKENILLIRLVIALKVTKDLVMTCWFVCFGFMTLDVYFRDNEADTILSGVMFTFGATVYCAVQLFCFPRLHKRFTAHRLLLSGVLLMSMGIGFVPFSELEQPHWLIGSACTAVLCAGFAFVNPAIRISLSCLSTESTRGEVLGWGESASNVTKALSPPMLGWLYVRKSWLPFLVAAATNFLCLLLAIRLASVRLPAADPKSKADVLEETSAEEAVAMAMNPKLKRMMTKARL